jgi:hypothetical protein
MKWIKASERKPDKDGVFIARKNGQYILTTFDKKIEFGIRSDSLEWLDESESPTPAGKGKTMEEINISQIELLYDAFCNWYEDDGSRDTFLRSEAMTAVNKYATQQTAAKDAEIADLKRWKAEAVAVMPPMQEIGKALGINPGHFIHDKILPGIVALKEKINELTMDNMTQEYNQSEAARFLPEYRRQVCEPLEAEIEGLKKLNTELSERLNRLIDRGGAA